MTGNAFAIWDRRVNDDYGVTSGRNPRADFGLTNVNVPHAFTAGGNWDAGRGWVSGRPSRTTRAIR